MKHLSPLGLLKESFSEWQRDKASRLAAALAYYTAFSIAPLLLLIISIAGIFLGDEAARGTIFYQLEGLLGPEAAVSFSPQLPIHANRVLPAFQRSSGSQH